MKTKEDKRRTAIDNMFKIVDRGINYGGTYRNRVIEDLDRLMSIHGISYEQRISIFANHGVDLWEERYGK